jgi:hypothetical protein
MIRLLRLFLVTRIVRYVLDRLRGRRVQMTTRRRV